MTFEERKQSALAKLGLTSDDGVKVERLSVEDLKQREIEEGKERRKRERGLGQSGAAEH